MPEDRRLAAIMFTDIVGYTSLMGSDEDKAFRLLRKNRDLQRPLIKKYRGEWLKEMGDGILASFSTASDAVRCAGEIQNEAKKEGIGLRIGIHEGEVVFEGSDVLGDGVNVASRLEEFAEEGCINISGAVYKDIKNKAGIEAEFIEEKALKNVEEPVKVYKVHCEEEVQEALPEKPQNKRLYYIIGILLVLIVAVVLIWFFFPRQQPIVEEAELEKSIAVLPFKNLSPDEENQYFADGIMEGILNHLSKIKDIRVASRTSVEKYRDGTVQSPQIGNELNVSYLLEASVFKSEDKIRVTAQLIDAGKDEHIWSDQYDRKLEDVFEVMSDISQEVASEVKVAIAPEVKERIESIPTENLEAYDLFLKGKDKFNDVIYNNKGEALDEAESLFRSALSLDETFGLGYVYLALCYNRKYGSTQEYFKEDFLDSVLILANMALDFDDQLEEAYRIKSLYMESRGNIKEAVYNIDRALEINPNYTEALSLKGRLYAIYYDDYVNAISSYHKAIQLEHGPSLPSLLRSLGYIYSTLGLAEKAESCFVEAQKIDFDSLGCLADLRGREFQKGNIEKAIELNNLICSINPLSWRCDRFEQITIHEYDGNWGEAAKIAVAHDSLLFKSGNLNIARKHRVGYLLWRAGRKKEAMTYFNKQIEYAEESIRLKRWYSLRYGSAYYDLGGVYAFIGQKDKAYQNLDEFEDIDFFPKWLLEMIQYDSLFNPIRGEEKFQLIVRDMEEKNQRERDRVLTWMEQEGML
ncbi:adenylate/guanylate cyclase domain-containing protein [Bacteroidota bacterium]